MTSPLPHLSELRKTCRATLPDIAWAAERWSALGWLGRRRMNRALQNEMAAGHALATLNPQALAAEFHQDNVLFALADGRVALVHLTYGPKSASPDWPTTTMYPSLEYFLGGLAQDYATEFAMQRTFELGARRGPVLCSECRSNWSEGDAQHACKTCGGWPLARPCVVCDGQCGAIWERAVEDSQDFQEAHWIGACKRQS